MNWVNSDARELVGKTETPPTKHEKNEPFFFSRERKQSQATSTPGATESPAHHSRWLAIATIAGLGKGNTGSISPLAL